MRWTFVLLLVSPYFIDVAWQILRQCVLIFFKVIRQNIVVSFPEAVRDNVVSNDVMITSSLRSDVIVLGINFPFLSKMSPHDGSCQKLRN